MNLHRIMVFAFFAAASSLSAEALPSKGLDRSDGWRPVWCNSVDARRRMEPLSSSVESLSSMVDEWRLRESVRPDGTCYFNLSKINPAGNRDFILNLRARTGFNAKTFYFGNFVHDRAGYGRFLEKHPNFIGFESWEWGNDAYLPIRRPSVLTMPSRANHLSSNELQQVVSRVRMPPDRDGFVEKILRPVFDRISEWHYGDTARLLLGEGHYCIGHLAAYWGVGQIGIETTRDYLFWQIQMMFCRGAANQFDVPWKWYIASYLGGKLNGAFKDGSYCAESHGRAWHGPEYGISQSAIKRATYLTYLSGANWYERENMAGTHFLVKDGPPRLSEEGLMYDRFYGFTRRVKRGRPFVPFALLVPAHRGYTRKAGQAFDKFEYTRPDHMLDAVMSVILDFPRNRQAGNFSNRIERVMANSPYGDVFDALTPDFPDQTSFARTIGDYRAAILAGDYGRNKELETILRKYVKRGGTLVMSSSQFDTFPVEAKLLRPMRNPEFSAARIGKGRVIVGRTPFLVPWEGEGKEAAERALAKIRIGEPCRFRDIEWLIEELEHTILPVKVSGPVQYGINETADGLLVYLINNEGVVKFPDKVQQIAPGGTSVTVDFSRLGSGRVMETVENREVAFRASRVELKVPYGDIRVLKIDLPENARRNFRIFRGND